MASWSMQNQHPDLARRSSRSRSPRRRDRDSGYPDSNHDHSLAHSGYGQDRGWDEYYEKRGRGRSRSPGDESMRKRRRSHSPYDRDRFEPRPRHGDDYDTHSRSYGYSSPRSKNGSHYSSYQQHSPTVGRPNRPPPMDPYLYQPQAANLRQYAEWFRATYPKEAKEEDEADRAAEKEAGRKTRDGIRARWEKYKKKHLSMQLQTLFDHHKRSPWFSEKYNPAPEWVNLRNRVRKQGWKGRPEQFLKDLEEGKYDPKREPGPSGKDTAVLADEKAHQEDVDLPDEDVAEAALDTLAKNEINGKPTGLNGRNHREDDVFVYPDGDQIAIRTIPPDIGRQKIEETCRSIPGFIHLALGDPLQKRQYYRAGWMKFQAPEDTDIAQIVNLIGEKKIDGFKLHVSHVPRPYYGRLRQAPTTPGRIEKDLQQVKQLASILEDEYAALLTMKNGAPEPKLEEANAPKDGEQDVSMTEDQTAPINEAENMESERDVEPETFERGSEAVERRIEKLALELASQQDGGEGDGSDSQFELNKSIIALDLYVAYIRAAYNTCYYCAAVCDHVEELNRKCPKHVRKMISDKVLSGADDSVEQKDDEDKPAKDQPKEREKERRDRNDDIRRMEMLDSKIALLINRSGIDPLDYGGKNPDEELRKAVEPYIKQEEEGKFRCRTCTKLFKAASFVEKHISNKHAELIKQLDELPFFNNFALDPSRIQPFTHLPPPVGNNIPNPHAYGLQAPPPAPYPMDYARPPVPGFYGGFPPPPGAYPPYGAPPGMYEYYHPGHWPPPQGRKDDHAPSGRRLQERMGGYASTSHLTLTGVEGLPPKPVAAIESNANEAAAGGGGERGGGGAGGGGGRRRGRASTGGPPPPPPADAKEDPRAAAGRKVSYHDMDDVAEGDVELTY